MSWAQMTSVVGLGTIFQVLSFRLRLGCEEPALGYEGLRCEGLRCQGLRCEDLRCEGLKYSDVKA